MPDSLHSDYEFEKVQIWFVSRAIVASEKDNHFRVEVSPEEAIAMLQARLVSHEGSLPNPLEAGGERIEFKELGELIEYLNQIKNLHGNIPVKVHVSSPSSEIGDDGEEELPKRLTFFE